MNIIIGIIALPIIILIGSALLSIPGSILGGAISGSPKEGWESFKRQTKKRAAAYVYCIVYGGFLLGLVILIVAIFGSK